MKSFNLIPYFFIFILVFLFSCSNDDIPKQVVETEVITDVELTFKENDGKETTYTYTDPKYLTADYEEPVIRLKTGKTYQVTSHFYDKSNPDEIEDITEEVIEEKDAHFVEYRFHKVNIALTRRDGEEATDSDGIQIGVTTEWKVGESSEGSVQQTLIHQPESKSTSDPLGNHVGGETDVEVLFDLIIE